MQLKSAPTYRPTLYGNRHMVVSGHALASMAGMQMLEAGGNAIDAGVAAGFALNVVQPDMANLGGVAPIVLYRADTRAVTTISGVGRWPKATSADRLRRAGHGRIPVGPLRWVVPATVDAWITALARYGTMSVQEILVPAIALAERGFATNYFIRHNLEQAHDAIQTWPTTRSVFMPNGRIPGVGDLIVQRELAQTLRMLGEAESRASGSREATIMAARDRFYRGDIAEQIGSFAKNLDAYLTADDLREFRVSLEEPVSTTYRGHTVYACGPWSQGPAVLQMLNLMEGYPVSTMSEDDVAHFSIESTKRALLDRNRWYGDPEVVDVPLARLLSKGYADDVRRTIERDSVLSGDEEVPVGETSPDTTYVCVVDGAGNAFSATPSDSTMLVTPLVPHLGFAISDRGLQASLDGSNPNSVAPGKRPRLTPNPGLVIGSDFVMPYGTPGGDVQTQAMLQFLIQVLDHGTELQAAVESPRWATYAVPATEDPHPVEANLVRLEQRLFDRVGTTLAARGHRTEAWADFAALAGGICAIRRHVPSGVLAGAADPRRLSYGIGW